MVLLFGLPAFLAYGVVYEAGPLFYLGTVATLIPFLCIFGAIGVLITTALVLLFPAQRYHQFALCLYIDQSELHGDIDFDARMEMQRLDKALFRRYLEATQVA